MPDAPREYLVLLESHLADSALAQLTAFVVVTQRLVPRLVLIRVDSEHLGRVASVPGVVAVYDDAPGDLPPDLTFSERVFVSAWAARRHPKTRTGEGLDWDAPGFSPPDEPPQRR